MRTRVVSPAGFLLALLLFVLLPFVAVACDTEGFGSAEVEYRGLDLVTGADRELLTTDEDGVARVVEQERDVVPSDTGALPGVRVIAVLVGLVMLAVAVVSVRARRTVTAWLALVAGVAVVAVQALAQSHLETALRRAAVMSTYTVDSAELDRLAEETIHSRVGFWATLAVLGLVLIFNVVAVLRARRLTST